MVAARNDNGPANARVTDPLGLTGIRFTGMASPIAGSLNDFGGGTDGGLGLSLGIALAPGGGVILGPKTWAGAFGLTNCGPGAIGLMGPGTSTLGPVEADVDDAEPGSVAPIESILASIAADSLSWAARMSSSSSGTVPRASSTIF